MGISTTGCWADGGLETTGFSAWLGGMGGRATGAVPSLGKALGRGNWGAFDWACGATVQATGGILGLGATGGATGLAPEGAPGLEAGGAVAGRDAGGFPGLEAAGGAAGRDAGGLPGLEAAGDAGRGFTGCAPLAGRRRGKFSAFLGVASFPERSGFIPCVIPSRFACRLQSYEKFRKNQSLTRS